MIEWLANYLPDLWAHFLEQWWLYAAIPFISAGVGFVTNMMALEMMFKPIEFIGIKPIFGWQGIVPRKAEIMAGIAVDTITSKLISTREITDRIDPDEVARLLREPLKPIIEDVVYDMISTHNPTLWNTMPKLAKEQIIKRAHDVAPTIAAEVTRKFQQDADHLLDIKHMVITNLMKDKMLLNRIFLDVGEPEFKFVARSGAYFGFLFGIPQMLLYLVYPANWVLPLFGLLVGYATNWIALKVIFEPKDPIRVGLVKIQGLFLKRQAEVGHAYASLVADEILTPQNMADAVLNGPNSDALDEVLEREVKRAIDDSVGITMPVVTAALGSKNYKKMKETAVAATHKRAGSLMAHVGSYLEEVMDVKATLSTRLAALSPKEFEGLLRPAFEQDEWILIAVGAGLGMLAGFAQLFFMFS